VSPSIARYFPKYTCAFPIAPIAQLDFMFDHVGDEKETSSSEHNIQEDIMSKMTENFMAKVVDALDEHDGEMFAMDALRMESNHIVVPISALITDKDALPIPILLVTERHDALFVEAHELLYLGSPGSLMNAAVDGLLKELLYNDKSAVENRAEDIRAFRMLSNLYLSSDHTGDELLASAIQATNAATAFTTAIKDPFDGEILVRSHMHCDFNAIPEEFSFLVGGVLDHSARIRRFVTIMRRLVLPDSTNFENVVEAVLSRISSLPTGHDEGVSKVSRKKSPNHATL